MKRMERGEQEPPSVLLASTRLLYHMGNIFRDMHLSLLPTASKSTASGWRGCGKSASPSAASRTIMNSNRRDIRCSSIDSLRHKARIFCTAEVNKTFSKTHRCK